MSSRSRGRAGIGRGAVVAAGLAACVGLVLAVTALAAPPTLVLSATNATVGGTIHASAELSEATPTAGGEITFEVFGPGDATCAGSPLTPTPTAATVSGPGTYASGNFTTTGAGTYHWSAHYTGDGENEAGESICAAASTVSKATPALSGAATNATVNSAIHDTVTVTGAFSPTAEVTFKVFGPGDTTCTTALDTKTAAITAGQAQSPNYVPTQAGSYRWIASFPGDTNNATASTACNEAGQTSTVSQATPALSGSATNATVNSAIHDTVTVTGAFSPTAEVTFKVFGPADTTCTSALETKTAAIVAGQAQSPNYVPTQAGSYRWIASFPGDTNNAAASTACNEAGQTSAVSQATTSLSGAATNAAVGSPIHDTVTVTGAVSPTAEVTFEVFGPGDTTCTTALDTKTAAIVAGQAQSPNYVPQLAGSYRWIASFPGDTNNEPASTACNEAGQTSTVSTTNPVLSGAASNATIGSPIHDTVTVTGAFNPTAEVTFEVFGPGDTLCATPLAETSASIVAGKAQSPDYPPTQTGSYQWTASFPGDTNNEAASTACGATGQTSTVSKATPALAGVAVSADTGQPITDEATLSGAVAPTGKLLFLAYGPNDPACASAPAYEKEVEVTGNGTYKPAGFTPPVAGLYEWTVAYPGDAANEGVATICGDPEQSSAAGVVGSAVTSSATDTRLGGQVSAAATLTSGAKPRGQITFSAFPPTDVTCSGPAAFTSAVAVTGAGAYASAAFAPNQAGAFRWTVAYSGDTHHAASATACGVSTSTVSRAAPGIVAAVKKKPMVGTAFQVKAFLSGAIAPTGTVTFTIYGPNASDCSQVLAVDRVTVSASGPTLSDPFTAQQPGRYLFVATYSGDASNEAASQACNTPSATATVQKRKVQLKPTARRKGHRILVRAKLTGAITPKGKINFLLYKPGDSSCKRRPAFRGSVSARSNGNYALGKYIAKRGLYRLRVVYSGDSVNKGFSVSCKAAQRIKVP